ncbi:MAG: FAD-dependent oxidoreductase [Nocardiopsaceae bacterium]|nr:FAD-dependent oxidoreductase [Nocardiopsaceae bacterium]
MSSGLPPGKIAERSGGAQAGAGRPARVHVVLDAVIYPERTVVTGAGLAGLRTVVSLREKGYTGRVTLLGAELRPPYDRPPLSKKVLTSGADPSLEADFGALEADFRPGTEAVSLDAPGRAVVTASGPVPYDALVIATGATPVRLPGPGKQRVLRTYDDALALRELLRPGQFRSARRLAIVGAGWIGAELATAAATLGASVTVVEAGPTPLAAVFGPGLGSVFASWYAAAGVTLRTGTAVSSIEDGGLALGDGEWLPADEIVTAVGVRPAVGWLAGSGLALENGVAVDSGLRASLTGIFAVGDCASFPSGLFGARMRVEHWDSALHAPEVAAANVLGGDEVYDPVPYFWSDQFGRMVQYVGHHSTGQHGPADRLVWRGDPAEPKWTACWLAPAADADGAGAAGGVSGAGAAGGAGRLIALLTVGRPKDMIQARKLIAARAVLDPARVADPAVQLKNTVA